MARRVVLVASTRQQQREAWQGLVRRAGYLPLAADSADRALVLLRKIRPALILLDAELGGATAIGLLRDIRGRPSLEAVPVAVVGYLPRDSHEEVTRDPHVLVRQVDAAGIADLLEEVLGGPRPTPRRQSIRPRR